MASHKHFTQNERIMLSALNSKGFTQAEIARELRKNQSSISRELKRNIFKNEKYHAGKANKIYHQRKIKANQPRKKIENDTWLKKYIKRKLRKYWSPEQIAGRVRKDHNVIVCHETIYQYIYNIEPELKKYLRQRKGKYRRRYGRKKIEKQREEAKKRRIDKRPQEVETRERIGDWEGDTIVGKDKSHILTHVDRKSGYAFADKLKRGLANLTRLQTIKRFQNIPKNKKHTITYDNGSTFAEHELTQEKTKIDIYFAYPYHSWERGCNENFNGLLRQFFPKKSSFANIKQEQIDNIVKLINNRPRKRLDYLTPHEVFIKNMLLT